MVGPHLTDGFWVDRLHPISTYGTWASTREQVRRLGCVWRDGEHGAGYDASTSAFQPDVFASFPSATLPFPSETDLGQDTVAFISPVTLLICLALKLLTSLFTPSLPRTFSVL